MAFIKSASEENTVFYNEVSDHIIRRTQSRTSYTFREKHYVIIHNSQHSIAKQLWIKLNKNTVLFSQKDKQC